MLPNLFCYEIGVLTENRNVAAHVRNLGVPTTWCSKGTLTTEHTPGRTPITTNSLVAGSVGFVHHALTLLNITIPAPLGYPDTLRPWLHRNIERTTVADARERAGAHRIFVKPAAALKQFRAGTTDNLDVAEALRTLPDNTAVFVSTPVHMLAEWRIFVCNGETLGVSQYLPDTDMCVWPEPTANELEPIVDAATAAVDRVAFTVDVARTDTGALTVVELNDGYALGSYDLPADTYFELLWTRWRQLVNTT